MVKGEVQEIHITDITSHGMGVGRDSDGAAVFVRGALPGDTVMAECYRAKKKYAEAEAVEIIKPSPDRVDSFCDLGAIHGSEDHGMPSDPEDHGSAASKSSACGGCQYCELAYEKQVEIKRRQIIQDLIRIGGIEGPEVCDTIAMDEPYYYRNKVTFQVGWNGDDPVVGFYRAGSHDIVDCPVCRIQAPPAEAVASSLRTFMLQEKITCFDSKTRKGLLKDVIVRSCFETGEVMVVLEINGTNIPEAGRLIDMMDAQINRISFADEDALSREEQSDTAGLKDETGKPICWSLESVYIVNDKNVPVLIAGKKTVSEELGGVKFEISPMSFYQVNPVQTVKLYDKVFEYAALSPGDSLLDLYCGVGSIGLYLEDRMDDTVSVLGIESNKSAVLDANRNAVINGVINARYICGAAEDVLPDILGRMSEHASSAAGVTGEGREAVDNDKGKQSCDEPEEGSTEWFARDVLASVNVAVLDPPRVGCDEKLLAAVAMVSPARIVYVSCDPATLARDVKYLTANGYGFIKATPVDMFPHTGHVECVVLMSRVKD
ncbi:MAG: 23S rRNA (uracil(1939)-C(5))-methyltransferase RlmD [Eubacterium sp.]|nr:23S rRNA (uracil(1939)-C(5))-methyltransferase RlmD [Eubacterium sp.]